MTAVHPWYDLDVGRDEAQRAAEEELSKPVYHHDDPSLIERAYSAVLDWLDDALEAAGDAAPGGTIGLVLLVIAMALLVLAIAYRVGPLSRSAAGSNALFETETMDADAHRRAADTHAREGRFAEAVRERLRAIVRELEQRGVLEPRAGRTADEAAAEAGLALPALAGDLRAAARTFDDVWYGGRNATAQTDAGLRELDQRVRGERLLTR